jgi:hypothetical protein
LFCGLNNLEEKDSEGFSIKYRELAGWQVGRRHQFIPPWVGSAGGRLIQKRIFSPGF